MPQVTNYSIMFYSSSDGYQNNRAQIVLYNGNTAVAYVRFKVNGATFPQDYFWKQQVIMMHLPESMIYNVIDLLRNEKPIQVYFVSGHGFLRTGLEPVGETEEPPP